MSAPLNCVSFHLWFCRREEKQTLNLVTSLNLFSFKALTPYREKNGLIEKKTSKMTAREKYSHTCMKLKKV